MVVYPQYWDPHSTEPVLKCRMMGDAITRAVQEKRRTESPAEAAARAMKTKRKEDEDRWRSIVTEFSASSQELRQKLVDDGWEDCGGDGVLKFIHVDDLEKIEGPPPEGVF